MGEEVVSHSRDRRGASAGLCSCRAEGTRPLRAARRLPQAAVLAPPDGTAWRPGTESPPGHFRQRGPDTLERLLHHGRVLHQEEGAKKPTNPQGLKDRRKALSTSTQARDWRCRRAAEPHSDLPPSPTHSPGLPVPVLPQPLPTGHPAPISPAASAHGGLHTSLQSCLSHPGRGGGGCCSKLLAPPLPPPLPAVAPPPSRTHSRWAATLHPAVPTRRHTHTRMRAHTHMLAANTHPLCTYPTRAHRLHTHTHTDAHTGPISSFLSSFPSEPKRAPPSAPCAGPPSVFEGASLRRPFSLPPLATHHMF